MAWHHHWSDRPTSARAVLHHTDQKVPNIMDPSVQFLTVINKVSRQYALRTYCPNIYTYRHQREAFPARCHTSLQPKVHTFSGVSLGRNSKVVEFHSSKILAKLPVSLSFCLFIGLAVRIQKKVPTKKLVLGIGDV